MPRKYQIPKLTFIIKTRICRFHISFCWNDVETEENDRGNSWAECCAGAGLHHRNSARERGGVPAGGVVVRLALGYILTEVDLMSCICDFVCGIGVDL